MILLNMKGGTRGFPSGVQDDPLMQLILGESDAYPDAEERRRLYVALTPCAAAGGHLGQRRAGLGVHARDVRERLRAVGRGGRSPG